MGNAMQNFGCRANSPRHFTPARRARPSRRTELSRPRSPASQARHAAKTGRAGPQASRMKRPVPYWAATTSRPAIWADQLVSTKRLQSATTDKMSKILSPRRAWWSFYDHNQAPWPRDDTYSALSRTQSPHRLALTTCFQRPEPCLWSRCGAQERWAMLIHPLPRSLLAADAHEGSLWAPC